MHLEWSILIFIQALICAFFCAFLARTKNRNGVAWFGLGFLFSVLALIAAAGMTVAPPQARYERPIVGDGGGGMSWWWIVFSIIAAAFLGLLVNALA